MKKRIISLICILAVSSTTAFASEPVSRNSCDENNFSILHTETDWEKMRQDDLNKYNAKLDSIDKKLVDDVNLFISENQELSLLQNSMTKSRKTAVSNEIFVRRFLNEYPEYAMEQEQIIDDINILRFNPVVETVRTFFSQKGYELSLVLFNHSLTDNPEPASLSLTGNTSGIYSHIRRELRLDPFLNIMKSFADAGNSIETIKDSSYTFDDGDLYWAIHGFTWTRTRTRIGRADFAIDDIYDFNKWQDIPGIVAGISGTHDFDVHIDGVVELGLIR